jgi:hypothetical protein
MKTGLLSHIIKGVVTALTLLIGGCALKSCSPNAPLSPVTMGYVDIDEISLTVYDTATTREGIFIRWHYDDEGATHSPSYYNLYHLASPDIGLVLSSSKIPGSTQQILIPFPFMVRDSNEISFGLEAVYQAATDQKYLSDSLRLARLIFIQSKPAILKPAQGEYVSNVFTPFSIQPQNDNGETYRFMAFFHGSGSWDVIDTTFPFSGRILFPRGSVTDSARIPLAGVDTNRINWCLLATQEPVESLVNQRQSLTCSWFYKVRVR